MLPPSVKVITKKSKLSAEVEDRENMYILEEEGEFEPDTCLCELFE